MNSISRLIWIIVQVFIGILGSGFLFLWISFDCYFPPEIDLLNFSKYAYPLNNKLENVKISVMIYDIALCVLWGASHSLFAQEFFQSWLRTTFRIPKQALRIAFYLLTAIATFIFLKLWVPTKVLIWTLPLLAPTTARWVNAAVFWLIFSLNLLHIFRFGVGEFVGLSQLYQKEKQEDSRSSGMPQLITTGFYGYMRHPIYFFTMIAYMIGTSYTLDRVLAFLGSCLYLWIAIPFEEEKLISIFGDQYKQYKKKVPAVIPRLF